MKNGTGLLSVSPEPTSRSLPRPVLSSMVMVRQLSTPFCDDLSDLRHIQEVDGGMARARMVARPSPISSTPTI